MDGVAGQRAALLGLHCCTQVPIQPCIHALLLACLAGHRQQPAWHCFGQAAEIPSALFGQKAEIPSPPWARAAPHPAGCPSPSSRPTRRPAQATYKNQCDTAFQDAVGRVVLEAAASIPDGLLVFMPSYSLLDRLMARWKVGGKGKGSGKEACSGAHPVPGRGGVATPIGGWGQSATAGRRGAGHTQEGQAGCRTGRVPLLMLCVWHSNETMPSLPAVHRRFQEAGRAEESGAGAESPGR